MDSRTRLGLACLLAIGLLAALLLPARYSVASSTGEPPQPMATATKVVPKASQSICTGLVTETLSSHNIRMCDEATVTASAWPSCPACAGGIHVVFVQTAVSPSAAWMNDESVAALRLLQSYRGQEMRVGVVHYNSQSVRRVLPMTGTLAKAVEPLNMPSSARDWHGDVIGAAHMAVNMLQDARKEHERAGGTTADQPCEFVIFFASTASLYADQEAKIREAGQMITRNGTALMAGCPETNVGDYCRATRDMPDPRQYYTEAPLGLGRMQRFLGDEMDKVLSTSGLSSMSLWQGLPAGLQYVNGSASEAPKITVQTDNSVRLSWDWIRLTSTEPHTVTFRVRPLAEGSWQMSGMVTMKDRENKVRELALPDETITVAGNCGVATPTALPPTLTPVPTATATPTAVPTQAPRSIYLPKAAKDS